MHNYLWVVEIKDDDKWAPTVGAYLDRATAREQKQYTWEANNHDEEFRIRKYFSEFAS